VDKIGTAIVKMGLQTNDTVGIFGINSPEWMKVRQ
jgi:long-subunit acyl-CoA synthetase (AMP-forming)